LWHGNRLRCGLVSPRLNYKKRKPPNQSKKPMPRYTHQVMDSKQNDLNKLRKAWLFVKAATGKTQVQASEEMGWARSMFSLILTGRVRLTENKLYTISNYLSIDPLSINPQAFLPRWSALPIHYTASGQPSPVGTHWLDSAQKSDQFTVLVDIPTKVMVGEDAAGIGGFSNIPINTILLCAPNQKRVIQGHSRNWKPIDTPLWWVMTPNKNQIIRNPVKPKMPKSIKVVQIIAIYLL